MVTRSTWAAAGILLALCAESGPALGAVPGALQTGAQTSHRMKSLDKELMGKKYLEQARIQPEQARALALRAFDGRIVYERIENKPGGSGLRYSFVIKNSRAEKHRVDIDANDGATLENTPTRERW